MKKLTIMLLVFALAFSIAACSGGKSFKDDEGENEKTLVHSNAAGDGLTWDGALPLVAEGEEVTLTVGLKLNSLVLDYETNEYTKWLEDQTGVNLEFVTFAGSASDVRTQFALMIAGDETLPDILIGFDPINKALMKEYGKDGYLIDLSQSIISDSYYLHESIHTVFSEEAQDRWEYIYESIADPVTNEVYGWPGMWWSPFDLPLGEVWINNLWLDAVGMEKPTTVDELYDVLVTFRDQDPNGNGIADEIPMIGIINYETGNISTWLINAFTYLSPPDKFAVEDGKVYSPYITDEYRQAMIFINKLVSEGLLNPMTFTMKLEDIAPILNPADGVYLAGIISDDTGVSFAADSNSAFDYDYLDPLADCTGKGGYSPMYKRPVQYTCYITKDCENPDIAVRLFDFMSSQESFLRQRYGVEGVDWEYSDGTKPGSMGGTAKIKLNHDNIFYEVNNQTWHMLYTINGETYWEFEVDWSDPTDWQGTHARKMLEQYQTFLAGERPEQTIRTFARATEDDEAWSEVNAGVNEFVRNSIAYFGSGEWDPNNDQKWAEYVEQLKQVGMQVQLDAAQRGWDRMHPAE